MALENMAASFSGLPMGDLIGGPLNAACAAQVRLAMATVDFIKVVGFEPPPDADHPWGGKTRTASFKFKRPVLISPATPAVAAVAGSAAQDAKPEGKDANGLVTPAVAAKPEVKPVAAAPAKPAVIQHEDVELEVPVLAIVKIPALSINSVDITFDMEVKSAESSKDTSSSSGSLDASMTFGWGFLKGSVSVKGSVATSKENTRSSDNSAKYHVEVHARDNGMPEGLSRVLDILQQSVAPKAISLPA